MENVEQAQISSQDVGGEIPATQSETAPELNIGDLQNLRAIIDTATRRGAFGASEMSAVGSVFDRLNSFLNAVTPPPTQEAPKTPPQQ